MRDKNINQSQFKAVERNAAFYLNRPNRKKMQLLGIIKLNDCKITGAVSRHVGISDVVGNA